MPDKGGMAQLASRAVGTAFAAGIHIAAPLIVVITVLYIGMGVLARLMPQVQVFMIAIPAQLLIAFVIMALTISSGLMYWLSFYEEGLYFFFSGG